MSPELSRVLGWLRVGTVGAGLLVAGCGAAAKPPVVPRAAEAEPVNDTMREFRDSAKLPPPRTSLEEKTCAAPKPEVAPQECPPGSDLVYVVTRHRTLHSFDPVTYRFQQIGELRCPTTGWPRSMAVDRNGHAWVGYDDGVIMRASISDASCEASSIPHLFHGDEFGMGFAPTPNGSFVGESLFLVQDEGSRGLFRVDTDGGPITRVGSFPAPLERWRGELTSSADGRLFGLFIGDPFAVAEIDKSSAKVVGQRSLRDLRFSALGFGAFAFANVGTDFFVFSADGATRAPGKINTKVTRVHGDGSHETIVPNAGIQIVGAGVSTCSARGGGAKDAQAVPPPLPAPRSDTSRARPAKSKRWWRHK